LILDKDVAGLRALLSTKYIKAEEKKKEIALDPK
jgi:hypothetical protein